MVFCACGQQRTPLREPTHNAIAALMFERGPVNPKYRTAQHRRLSAQYKRQIRAGHTIHCTAAICLFGRAPITNTNGNQPDGVTVGHSDNGTDIDGPQHRLCNTTDGARRARAKQLGSPLLPRRLIL